MNSAPRLTEGIQARLSASLGALALLTLAACIVGWIAFSQIQTAAERITGESYPRSTLALQIAEHSALVTAGAPTIMSSDHQAERQRAREAVEADFLVLVSLAQRWDALGGKSASAARLSQLAGAVEKDIEILDRATRIRLDLAARRMQETALLLSLHEEFLEVLESVIDDAVFDMVMQAEGRDSQVLAGGAASLDALQTLKAEGNLAAGLLNEAANVPDRAILTPLKERLDAARGQMERALRKLPEDERFAALREITGTLLQLGELGGSIIELRREELDQLARAHAVLADTRKRSDAMSEESHKLVAAAETASQASAGQAQQAIASGKWLLLIFGLAALVGALGILAGYVRPRVIQPIGEITRTMSRLAEGDTGVDIPGRERRDELGRMAQALEVFRDITVQIQKSNLREIEEARRRLSDAIESISEAFSLFDADDRLVVFNRMYLDMVNPEIRDFIEPGVSFEDIMRRGLEAGTVPDAEGREDAWLAERMDQHQSARETHIQRRVNGQWILISERRTAEGGVVAVYSDITELKEREHELAEKTRKLQTLSNQLSKYLAPQVYQSIFTGQQTAAVASQRKKLTVYFSDIAGFTETADRMESEDMTEVLNEYLTEMSRIALAHGATIDKYIGDAIMIFFGDPVSRGVQEDALACVHMAIEMRNRLKELAGIWESRGLCERLVTRTGIHTGYCTVGNFGSEDRMDYTIIGGAVNLASRLESAAGPGSILISNETYSLVHEKIHCRQAEVLNLKGLAYPVQTWVAEDTHASLGSESGHVFADQGKLVLDANVDAMDSEERAQAARTLRRVLRRLEPGQD